MHFNMYVFILLFFVSYVYFFVLTVSLQWETEINCVFSLRVYIFALVCLLVGLSEGLGKTTAWNSLKLSGKWTKDKPMAFLVYPYKVVDPEISN